MVVVKKLLALAALVAAPLVTAGAAEPGASDWASTETGRVRLIAAQDAVGDAASLKMGLHFQLQPGWKIYWRTPGDAGYPPKVVWDGSVNMGTPAIAWPAPKRFTLAGLQNYGYSGEVVLPLDVPVTRPGAPVSVAAALDYLACAQICVPMQASLRLDLPAGPASPSAFVHDIGRFSALVPGDGARHGLSVDKAEAIGDGDAASLRLTVTASEPFDHPDVFVEPAELAGFEAPRVALSQGGRRAVIEAAVVKGTLQRPLAGAPLTVTLVDGARALEAAIAPVPAAATPAAPEGAGLLPMLLVALLGGLVLNLMPCVLPVLSIKVLGALSQGGAGRGHVRASFLASAAGIVASFLALAAAAVAVKAAGQAVGWGIQFQQPLFLAVMIALLLAFAANLWGAFEIRLPSALMNVGPGGIAHHTLVGHFLSGAFATLLATPCSAPFLGTAIGFALARGPAEIFAIFIALGLGLALPYLAVAAWPDLARRLPKPGAWMVVVKKAMGVALAATALWLGTIMAVQLRGDDGARAATDKAVLAWIPFDQGAIAGAVAAGKVVFVDVTADWCITCKVNKAAVIERGAVAARLGTGAVLPMRADWTRPDDTIARYLAGFGRYGIPFNAVYGPGAPDGIALSELLTEAEVLTALDRAAR